MEQLESHNQENNLQTSIPVFESFMVKRTESNSQNSSQLDEDKCYLMEIQQLKRQNNFLKKKLAQFTKKQRFSLPVSANKRPYINFGTTSHAGLEEASQNYIISFIDEVTKLLLNFSNLFNIDLQCRLEKELQAQNKFFNDLTTQKTDELNRRLRRILLQPEQNKYQSLLQIFSSYYRQTSEQKKLLRQKIEQLTSQAIEMGNKMATTVKSKQKLRGSIKGSRVFHAASEVEESRQMRQQFLKSSIIKSTCTDQIYQVDRVRMSLGKQKLIYNLF